MWFSLRPIFGILRSVSGVTNVKRNWFHDDRILFQFHGKNGLVNEPWGDSSRYWVGLTDPNESNSPCIEPIEAAFRAYKRSPWIFLWQRSSDES